MDKNILKQLEIFFELHGFKISKGEKDKEYCLIPNFTVCDYYGALIYNGTMDINNKQEVAQFINAALNQLLIQNIDFLITETQETLECAADLLENDYQFE